MIVCNGLKRRRSPLIPDPGPTLAPNKTMSVDFGTLPGTVTMDSPSTRQITVNPAGGTVTLDRWNIDGYDIRVQGTGTCNITNCIWTPKTGSTGYCLGVNFFDGVQSGSTDVTVDHCTINCITQAVNGSWAIQGNGTFTVTNSTISGVGVNLIVFHGTQGDGFSGTRNLIVQYNLLRAIGMNARNGVAANASLYWNGQHDYNYIDNTLTPELENKGGAHCEYIKFNFGGTFLVDNNTFDMRDHTGVAGAASTGFLAWIGYEGRPTGTVSNNRFFGNLQWARWSTSYVPRLMSYAFQCTEAAAGGGYGSYSYDITFTNNRVDPGDSGYIVQSGTGGSPAVAITGTLNVNDDTGELAASLNVGGGGGGAATWDTANKPSTVTLSGSDLVAEITGTSGYVLQRAGEAITADCHWEVTCTNSADLGNWSVGVASASAALTGEYIGVNNKSGGMFAGGGQFYCNGSIGTEGAASHATEGFTLLLFFKFATKKLFVYSNGAWYGDTGVSDDPTVPTGGADVSAITGSVYPVWGGNVTGEIGTLNAGATAFVNAAAVATLIAAGSVAYKDL